MLFLSCFVMFQARLFVDALWPPDWKGLTSGLSFVVRIVTLSLSHWYQGQVWCLIVSICPLSYFANGSS